MNGRPTLSRQKNVCQTIWVLANHTTWGSWGDLPGRSLCNWLFLLFVTLVAVSSVRADKLNIKHLSIGLLKNWYLHGFRILLQQIQEKRRRRDKLRKWKDMSAGTTWLNGDTVKQSFVINCILFVVNSLQTYLKVVTSSYYYTNIQLFIYPPKSCQKCLQ